VNSVGNFGNKREDVVEKATHLMAKITHAQPFEDGNRRTGIISAMQFLRDNGYELEIESGQANLDIRKMLKEIKMHMRGLHKETRTDFFLYFKKDCIIMSKEQEKSTNELIEKHSDLLEELAHDD
jgi:prophage maintenance system killer protein